ncbi:unnamed protein product [Somion occarium]|uniref:Kri1-like C-terminal domain-containing protein n=1 Tax=Somion occarium TaxID=3059160 RepID=A0ABP1DW54_9APHY
MLSEDSDNESVQSIHQLTINEHFAKAYEYKKEREELAKLKEKYGSDYEDGDEEEDSEEAESEDEDGEELTPAVDVAILRTLARIKRKDPSIYEAGKDVFEEERKKTGESGLKKRTTKDKSKPLTMRQHALASALIPTSRSPSPEPLTHVEEQKALQKETIEAFHGAIIVEGDEDEDDLLVPREKTKDEIEREEEEYREFLQREVGEDLKGLVTVEEGIAILHEDAAEQGSKSQKGKKEKKKSKEPRKSKVADDQEFLMNYILNRGWIDKSEKRLPTYHEITASSKSKGKGKAKQNPETESDGGDESTAEDEELSEEVEFDEIADRFESSYNFRFEEPDAASIPRYPRNITSLVRREDSSRKEERERRKARKEEEVLKKKEEVKRLKALKMKELRVKLEQIGKEGGKNLEETIALQKLDLEADWDPEAHDRQMADIYGQEEDDILVDEDKPTWDDDIDVADIVPPESEGEEGESSKKKKKKKKKKKDKEEWEQSVDVDEMDADVQQYEDEEEWDGTEEMRKKKLEEYMDELYNLEFNDMVAGMPTRFKYTKVQPQAFALTPEEILLATDAELNQYMGIKKYAPYRKDGSNWDKNRAARFQELKTKIKERRAKLMGERPEEAFPETEKPAKKRKGKKERMKEKAVATAGGGEQNADVAEQKEQKVVKHDKEERSSKRKTPEHEESQEGPTKKKRRRHKKSGHTQADS